MASFQEAGARRIGAAEEAAGAKARLAPEAIGARLRLSKGQLADMLGVSADTLYRADRAAGSAKVQRRLMELTSILDSIEAWAGDDQAALAWYLGYRIPAFGGRTAEQLVKDGKAGAVRDWLDTVALGGFA